jgi:predicted MFS family arabinose efflux permease
MVAKPSRADASGDADGRTCQRRVSLRELRVAGAATLRRSRRSLALVGASSLHAAAKPQASTAPGPLDRRSRYVSAGVPAAGRANPRVWDALRDPAFRSLWAAGVVAVCVIWMQDVGAQWLMKELSGGDPLRVSLVQSFSLLPVVLLALPAGTLSDLAGHRRLLIGAMVWTAAWSLLLVAGSLRGAIGPGGLLLLVFLLGIGKAVILPSFAAACAQTASPARLDSAVGLHSMANNAGRVLGPGLAGVLIAAIGVASLFGVAFAVTLCAILLLARDLPPRRHAAAVQSAARTGGFAQAIVDGLSYCVRQRAIRNVIARSFGYFLCAVAVHALLPLLIADPRWFGIGWAAYGVGAVVGALGFSTLSRSLPMPRQLSVGIGAHAALLVALALLEPRLARTACLFALGVSWYLVVSSAQLALQRLLPDEIRARGLSLFTIMLTGAFMIGAPLWGLVAATLGVAGGLLVAAGVSALALSFTWSLRIEPERST